MSGVYIDLTHIARLQAKIDARLENHLLEMKPDYDDAITGFNEAWDIIRAVFTEVLLTPPAINKRNVIIPTQRDIDLWRLEAKTHLRFGGVLQLGKFNWPQAVLSLIAELEKRTNDMTDSVSSTTAKHIDFYEREFYPLSNFSSFTLMWEVSKREGRQRFDTSEAVYHWEKFNGNVPTQVQRIIQRLIREAPSAHEAFRIAKEYRKHRRPTWDDEKVGVMLRILRAKTEQHEYVRRKLLETGDRPLIEASWHDNFWGWGPNRDGRNMLGKLWMQVRQEIREETL